MTKCGFSCAESNPDHSLDLKAATTNRFKKLLINMKFQRDEKVRLEEADTLQRKRNLRRKGYF